MNSNVRAIYTKGLKVCFAGKLGKNLLPKRRLGPAMETFVHGLPGAELLWEITPRSATMENPKDAIEHEAGIFGWAAPGFHPRWAEQWLKALPKVISYIVAAHAA